MKEKSSDFSPDLLRAPPTSGMNYDFWWTDWAEIFCDCWSRIERIITNFLSNQSFLFGRKTIGSSKIGRVSWGRFLALCSRLKSLKMISVDRKHLNEETDVELFSKFCFADFWYASKDTTCKKDSNSEQYKWNNSALD